MRASVMDSAEHITLPAHTADELRATVARTRLVVALYFLILGVAAVCLVVVLFWAKARTSGYGFPRITDIALWFVATFTGAMIVYYMIGSVLRPRQDIPLQSVGLDPASEPEVVPSCQRCHVVRSDLTAIWRVRRRSIGPA